LTTAQVGATAWTSGDLTTFLGISASPPNPLSSWLPATQTVDPGATGYFVQQGILSNPITIPGNPPPALTDLFNASAVPQGTVIVAFLETSPNTFVSTAQSGGLFVGSSVPEPTTWAMMLLGFVGLGFVFRQSRRKVSFA
jgi:PEP-CTERM motif